MKNLTLYRPDSLNILSGWDRMLENLFDDEPYWKTDVPAVDIQETEKSWILEAELPGSSEKEIDVKIEENLLTISSAREEDKEENKKGYVMKERKSRTFRRSFVLPENADKESISAEYANGLLTLTINKAAKPEPKKIEVIRK